MIPRKNQPSEHGGNLKITVNSDISFSEAVGKLREEYQAHKYLTVSINTGKARTVPLNSLSYRWFTQISAERGDITPGEIKCIFKLYKGLPILRGMDEDSKSSEILKLCDFCDTYLDHMPYEAKLAALEFLPVTSLMTTVQFKAFLTEVQYNCALKNIILFWPDEDDSEKKK